MKEKVYKYIKPVHLNVIVVNLLEKKDLGNHY